MGIQRWKTIETWFLTSMLLTKLQWKTAAAVCARPQQMMQFSGNWSRATICDKCCDKWKHLSRRWLFKGSGLLRLLAWLMHGAHIPSRTSRGLEPTTLADTRLSLVLHGK